MTKKLDSSKAGVNTRKKPKLKKATLRDLASSERSKVRGGVAAGTVTCATCGCSIRCVSVIKILCPKR